MKNIPQQLCALLGGLLVSACVWAHGASGYPGYEDVTLNMLLAPAGTPKAVIDKMHAEVQRIAASPDVRERLTTLGAEPSAMTPTEFGNWLKAEIPAMAKIVKDEKITVE